MTPTETLRAVDAALAVVGVKLVAVAAGLRSMLPTGDDEDNPPITCPYCGSTDQEYIYGGDWICGDCGERWNERQKGEGMTDDLIRCPVCGSDNVDGEPVGDGVEMPNPDDEDRPIIGYAVVHFVCRACGHRWVDDSTNPAHSHSDGDQHNGQQ